MCIRLILIDRVEILLQNNALEVPELKPAILTYIGLARPWPDKAINLIKTYIPIHVIEEAAEKNNNLRLNLESARQKKQL